MPRVGCFIRFVCSRTRSQSQVQIVDDQQESSTAKGEHKAVPRQINLARALTHDLTGDGDLDMTASELFNLADTNKNGVICLQEFEQVHKAIGQAAIIQEQKRASSEKGRKLATKLAIVVGILFLLMLFGNAGLTASIVFLAKDTVVEGGKLMDTKGHTLKISSADTSVSDSGSLLDANTGGPVKVSEAVESSSLDSRLPDTVWKELKYVEFTSPTGGCASIWGIQLKFPRPSLHASLAVHRC